MCVEESSLLLEVYRFVSITMEAYTNMVGYGVIGIYYFATSIRPINLLVHYYLYLHKIHGLVTFRVGHLYHYPIWPHAS